MRFAPALALVCLVLPGVAKAAVVSYSAPASGATPPVTNTIAAFDPSLGTLEHMHLRLTGVASDSFSGGSRYGMGSTLEVVPYFSFDSLGSYRASEPFTVPLYSYQGYPVYSGGYSESLGIVVELPYYGFEAGPGGDLTYKLGMFTEFTNASRFQESALFSPDFRGTATVTYTYSPVGVPEPGSLALFVVGLAGCLAVARRAAGVTAPRRRLVLALALAGLMAPVAARAAAVSYSAPASGSGSGVLNTIADFDPALGTLERVQLRLTGTVSDYISGYAGRGHHSWDDGGSWYDGDGGRPIRDITATLTTAIPYVFLYLTGSELWGDPVTFYITNVSGYFSGGYSAPFESVVELPTEIFGTDLGLLPEFFGNHPDGGKTYALGAGTGFLGYSSSAWTQEADSEFDGTATMTYFYRPVGVPEPASSAVLGLGLTGCLVARASRRRRVRSAPR